MKHALWKNTRKCTKIEKTMKNRNGNDKNRNGNDKNRNNNDKNRNNNDKN